MKKKQPSLYSGGHGMLLGLLIFTGVVYWMRNASATDALLRK